MNRPVMVDLFSGVGGAARGYQEAGWYVIGVDKFPQPDSCADEFLELDLAPCGPERLVVPGELLERADAWHASPPCQAATALTKGTNAGNGVAARGAYPQYIPATRRFLESTGRPWVIENVVGAPMRKDLRLCGEMFGLGVIRHRWFEADPRLELQQPPHPKHRGRVAGCRHGEWFDGPYLAVYGEGGGKGTVAQWREAMGIDWTWDRKSIAEALPPSYAQFVGKQMIEQLEGWGKK